MATLKLFFLPLLLLTGFNVFPQSSSQLEGAWQGEEGFYTFAGNYYSYASFNDDQFLGTHGGSHNFSGNKLARVIEYNTFDKNAVGSSITDDVQISDNDNITINGKKFTRFDDGTPGELKGAWLITGRMENGEMNEYTPGVRKTMKILSGKRFQWIAYNTETREFMGTGGGTYTTENGQYTENIDFFSRDQTRVGASLPFEYSLKEGKWHHKGNSSKGDPIYEVWSRR